MRPKKIDAIFFSLCFFSARLLRLSSAIVALCRRRVVVTIIYVYFICEQMRHIFDTNPTRKCGTKKSPWNTLRAHIVHPMKPRTVRERASTDANANGHIYRQFNINSMHSSCNTLVDDIPVIFVWRRNTCPFTSTINTNNNNNK